MKKKSELTEPELFYIINSSESVEDIAEKVECSKRVVAGIREKNPQLADHPPEFKPLGFADMVKQPSHKGTSGVFVLTEGTSSMGDDMKCIPTKGDQRTPQSNPDYVTKIRK